MARRLMVMVALVAMAWTGLAMACGFDARPSPAMTRVQVSESIFVGRVVRVEVIERREVQGRPMELVEVQVVVDEVLKGDDEVELRTLYMAVEAQPTVAVEPPRSGLSQTLMGAFSGNGEPQALVQNAEVTQMAPMPQAYLGETGMPKAPEALGRFVFFAREHGSSGFVLARNDASYLAPLKRDFVEQTRRLVASESRGDIYIY